MTKIPFYLQLFVLMIISWAFVLGANYLLAKPQNNAFLGIGILAFAALNILNRFFFKLMAKGNHFQFNSFFLLQSFLRTILALGMVLGYLFLVKKPGLWLVVEYFVIYLIFTLAEIIRFVFNLRAFKDN
ncbi:MAG: hypothetical protein VXX63_02045 [Bacteroidota bacterium]|nr:hypothetical protein [Bacteroidota bacterium]